MNFSLRKIPIGVQDFRELRRNDYMYIDKTSYILDLINMNKYYFLPRPRRFGKSLLCSTMKYLFLWEKELFKWLYAENNWDWDNWYPVVYISFAGWWSGDTIEDYIARNGKIFWKENWQIKETKAWQFTDFKGKIQYLVEDIYSKFNRQVVILVDEYDRPVLNILHNIEEAEQLRIRFRDFYAGIKDIDSQIRLFFLTWITKILKMSIFSVLNNLQDLFYSPVAYSILWYTQSELEQYFDQELEQVAQYNGLSLEETKRIMKLYYNWYNFWNPQDRIYNPWDMNNLMLNKMFGMYWSSTWIPSSVEEYIRAKNINVQEIIERVYEWELLINEVELNLENLKTISAEVLFLTSRYLTIKDKEEDQFICEFPNKQVEKVVSLYFTKLSFGYKPAKDLQYISKRFAQAIKGVDTEKIKEAVEKILEVVSNISYEWIARNPEWWLKTVLMLVINLTIDFSITEKHFVYGRNDILLVIDWKKYVIEVKVDSSVEELEKQMKSYKDQGDVVIWILWNRKEWRVIVLKM